MYEKPKKNLKLIISSTIMLIIALPMMLFTFNMICSSSPYDKSGDDLASLGLITGAGIYIFSMLVAIAGLSFANKSYMYRWCKNLGIFLLVAIILDSFLLKFYFIITMAPLFLLTILYLLGTKVDILEL